jgi:ATP-dependent DNA ligase
MEARPAQELPMGREWQYEPKWDGFRCLAFRDHKRIDLRSKSGKPLTRYFPELVTALLGLKAQQLVLDGEIVIPIHGKLSFDDLLMRIHPASSRIEKLSRSTPCLYLVFDLLVDETGKSLVDLPLEKRRKELAAFASKFLKSNPTLHLSPATNDLNRARR